MCRALLYLAGICLLTSASTAAILRVKPDGTGDYPTIQAAVTAAAAGDTVSLANGVFLGAGNRDVDVLGTDITIRSEGGDPDSCVINCEGSHAGNHRGFLLGGALTSAAAIEAVAIINGYIYDEGGAIHCAQGASPTISNCVFSSNYATQGGAIAASDTSHPAILGCVFASNSGSSGGAISAQNGSSPVITLCAFNGNGEEAFCTGGAIRLDDAATVEITECTFDGNVAERGGAIWSSNSHVALLDCAFTGNQTNGQISGALDLNSGSVDVIGCMFDNNTAVDAGAGLLDACEVTMQNCEVTGNSGDSGALTLDSCTGALTECSFTGNSGGDGGAIAVVGDGPFSISDCVFQGNAAFIYGGAILAGSVPDLSIDRCTLVDNTAPSGSGIYLGWLSQVEIDRTIVTHGIGGEGIACDGTSSVALSCSNIYGNEGGDYVGCLAGLEGVDGNLRADPLFCDRVAGDLTLDAASPCADAPGCGLIGALEVGCGLYFSSITDVGNDQGRRVYVTWCRAAQDAPGSPTPVTAYELWRRIDPASPPDRDYPPGDWCYLASIPAHGEETYTALAETACDSTITGGMCWSVFFIRAATEDPYVFFDSAPDSGYSLDNLAPGVPTGFHFADAALLAWDEAAEENFDYFTVYGSETGNLDEAAFLIGQTIETTMDISGHPFAFYHLTATDFAGNEGNEATLGASGVEGVSGLPALLCLRPARPNPGRAGSMICFDLPRAGVISLDVYDAGGRYVVNLIDEWRLPGTHTVQWTGRDGKEQPVPAGVYFIHLRAGSEMRSERLLVID